MKETMLEIFRRSPSEALKEHFRRARAQGHAQGRAFLWQSTMGIHGKHRYGSFRIVTEEELSRRSHVVEYLDGQVSIYWQDVVLDPQQNRNDKFVPKEIAWALVPS